MQVVILGCVLVFDISCWPGRLSLCPAMVGLVPGVPGPGVGMWGSLPSCVLVPMRLPVSLLLSVSLWWSLVGLVGRDTSTDIASTAPQASCVPVSWASSLALPPWLPPLLGVF